MSAFQRAIEPPTTTVLVERGLLLRLISTLFKASEGRYGSPRITRALAACGLSVGRRRVIAAMQLQGLRAERGPKTRKRGNRKNSSRTSTSRGVKRCCRPDRVRRRFDVKSPNRVWVADVTQLQLGEMASFLCVIIDLSSRRVISWRIASSPDTALVASTLRGAFRRRKPSPGLIIHTDRGGEFANRKVAAMIRQRDAEQSMSRRGNCWDNAVAESFFATLKRECIYLLDPRRRHSLRKVVDDYLHWYNRTRLHSTLGYRSPAEFEATEFGILPD